jgi:hypothetical protein
LPPSMKRQSMKRMSSSFLSFCVGYSIFSFFFIKSSIADIKSLSIM